MQCSDFQEERNLGGVLLAFVSPTKLGNGKLWKKQVISLRRDQFYVLCTFQIFHPVPVYDLLWRNEWVERHITTTTLPPLNTEVEETSDYSEAWSFLFFFFWNFLMSIYSQHGSGGIQS